MYSVILQNWYSSLTWISTEVWAMAMRSHTNKKSTKDSGATTVQASLKSRPFASLAKPDPSRTIADVQAQLEHAQRNGHSLAKMNLAPRPSDPPMIQPKLTIGAPGDKYEQEADRVAQQVVQRLNAPKLGNMQSEQAVQRESLPEEEDELQMKPLADRIQRVEMPEEEDALQMKPDVLQRETLLEEEDELQMKSMVPRSSDTAMPASAELESAIAQARGSGQPIIATIRKPMEQAFGADFSEVRIHTDTQSDQLNRSIQARAFTTGQNVFFRQGTYQPGSRGGQELLAHELTHVVQQTPQQIIKKYNECTSTKRDSDISKNNADIHQKLESKIEKTTSKSVQRKFEAAENFQGRSSNQVGINEKVLLSTNDEIAKQHAENLEWKQIQGKGTLSSTNPDGSATFTAGDKPEDVVLSCYVKYTEQQLDSAVFKTVKPSGGYVNRKQGTNLKKLPDLWGVGFVGELFVTPSNVSFSNLKFREGTVAPVIIGDWNGSLGQGDMPLTDHSLGSWLPILKPNGIAVNQVDTEDWIETGTKSAPPTGHPSGYQWQIPWEYKGMAGTQDEITKVLHEVQDDGQGTATLSKGGVTVSSKISDPGSWLFPVSEDIARIKGGFPSQMTTQEENFLLNHTDIAANIHFMMRNNQTSDKNLQQLIGDECQYYNLAPP